MKNHEELARIPRPLTYEKLRNLAYLASYRCLPTTPIAVEEKPGEFVFWVPKEAK